MRRLKNRGARSNARRLNSRKNEDGAKSQTPTRSEFNWKITIFRITSVICYISGRCFLSFGSIWAGSGMYFEPYIIGYMIIGIVFCVSRFPDLEGYGAKEVSFTGNPERSHHYAHQPLTLRGDPVIRSAKSLQKMPVRRFLLSTAPLWGERPAGSDYIRWQRMCSSEYIA